MLPEPLTKLMVQPLETLDLIFITRFHRHLNRCLQDGPTWWHWFSHYNRISYNRKKKAIMTAPDPRTSRHPSISIERSFGSSGGVSKLLVFIVGCGIVCIQGSDISRFVKSGAWKACVNGNRRSPRRTPSIFRQTPGSIVRRVVQFESVTFLPQH